MGEPAKRVEFVCKSCLEGVFSDQPFVHCQDPGECMGGRPALLAMGEHDSWTQLRAILRDEVERELRRLVKLQFERFVDFQEEMRELVTGLVPGSAPVATAAVATSDSLEADVLAVFVRACEKKADQCQAGKHLAKTLSKPKAQIVAALEALEKDGKIYGRAYYNTRLWYLTGTGPGPIKVRTKPRQ